MKNLREKLDYDFRGGVFNLFWFVVLWNLAYVSLIYPIREIYLLLK